MIRQISTDKRSNTNPITTLIKPENPVRIKTSVINSLKLISLIIVFLLSTSYQSPVSPFRKTALELYLSPFKAGMEKYFEMLQKQDDGIFVSNDLETSICKLSGIFYQKENYLPAWTLNYDLNDNSAQMLTLIQNANYYGLNPNDYNLHRIEILERKLRQNKNKNSRLKIRQDLELSLTEASFKFMINLNRGWVKNDTSMAFRNYLLTLPETLSSAIGRNSITKDISALQPRNYEYKLLQQALVKFLNSVTLDNKDISIPKPEKDSLACYQLTKNRLVSLGLLDRILIDNDSAFSSALKKFQILNGLDPDGNIGHRTRKALEKSNKYRYEQVALNLDRLRKENINSDHYAYVNIPAFDLKLVRNNSLQKTFRVIVGKPDTPTPELSSKIEKIVTHPYWTVPKSIAVNEILPRLKEDSTYLSKHKFNLIDRNKNNIKFDSIDWSDVTADDFNYVFRQDASSSNALGEIKFIFPNKYSVYLHDTPGKNLFNKKTRAFSHGCVRLENPVLFAEFLARENFYGQQNDSIKYLLKNEIHEELDLQKPLDIYIKYLTCSADEQLNLYFYDDIYNKDKTEISNLLN